jgi:hypothetical protein
MIKTLKSVVRTGIDKVRRITAKNIDELYQESPYNSLMIKLHCKADYDRLQPEISFRNKFEKKIIDLSHHHYVKSEGVLYKLNRFKNNFSLREAFTDHTGLNSRMRFSIEILKKYFLDVQKVYLSEHNTNFHKNLPFGAGQQVTTSIYKPGDPIHQDLTALSYPDNSFDLCMSFEDLEHIPDYQSAINELYRVTKPSGYVLLSTPFIVENQSTLTRATIDSEGNIKHLLEPEYHGDPVIPQGILCYYHFGWDLLDAFKKAGFSSVKVVTGYNTKKLMLDTLLFIMAEKS